MLTLGQDAAVLVHIISGGRLDGIVVEEPPRFWYSASQSFNKFCHLCFRIHDAKNRVERV